MDRRLLASRLIFVVGVLVLVVAAIHLAATQLLKEAILERVLAPEMMPIVGPPFVLNHIVVGVLLLPLGFATLYSARGIRAGERWAWMICFSNGLALVALPIILALVMRGGPFNAVAFRVAEALVTIAAVALTAGLLWVRNEFFPKSRGVKSSVDEAQ